MPTTRNHQPPEFHFAMEANGRMSMARAGGRSAAREPVDSDTRYYVDEQPLTDALSRYVTRECADLLDVAIAAYLADRLGKRASGSHLAPGEHHWQRTLHVRVPVRDLRRWTDPTLQESLRATLSYLTEDDWQFEFVQRPAGTSRVSEGVQYLFSEQLHQPVRVALFSGGLDSLAGLARDLARDADTGSAGTTILVSANTNRRVLPLQRTLVDQVRNRTNRKIIWTVGHFGLRRRKQRHYELEERTQRTRGFAFTALGAVAALTSGAAALALYENGIGAINLPYTEWQLGAQSTRAMHPTFLALMERTIELACDSRLLLDLRSLYLTKGELCRALALSPLASLAPLTVSCDGFPQRAAGPKQCGTCTSCLLRRQALLAAGTSDDARDDFGYRTDVFRWYRIMSEDKRLAVDVMLDQARRIRRATEGDGDTWRRLLREFPMLLELPHAIAGQAERCNAIAGMYARYATECAAFAEAIEHRVRRTA